jgi:hypothetical protein
MITCEVCGKVFREQDHEEYSAHNNVAHLHEWKGVYTIASQYNPIPYIRFTEREIKERDSEIDIRKRLGKL